MLPAPETKFAAETQPGRHRRIRAAWPQVPERGSARHAWACANEPPEGTTANAKFVVFYEGADVRTDLSKSDRVVAVALYAACDLYCHEEIFAHYGTLYRGFRSYKVGKEASLLKDEIPVEQLPSRIYGDATPEDALFQV